MAEFIEEAVEFFRPFGGKPTGKPTVIDFPSKARIYFNHLGDEEAFSKYKGWNLTKIGIEELTQIVTLRRYLKLLGSLRSVERVRNGKRYPELRTQIISTTNPDGPGATWVKDTMGAAVPMDEPALSVVAITTPPTTSVPEMYAIVSFVGTKITPEPAGFHTVGTPPVVALRSNAWDAIM